MFSERTSVGLDVHARSVVACGLDMVTGQLHRQRLVPAPTEVLARLKALPAPVAVVCEAGPTGYGLARFLTAAGVRCVVAVGGAVAAATPGRGSGEDRCPGRGASGQIAADGPGRCGAGPRRR